LSEFLTRNFSLGSGSKSQILSTDADLQSLSPEISTSRQLVRAARMRLNVLMGNNINDSLMLDTSSIMPSLLGMQIPSMDEALKYAVSNRTDIQSIDYLRKANDGGSKIYKSNYLPSIAAKISAGTSSNALGDLFNFKDYGNWQVGVGLQWQMFDGFASSAKAQQYQSDSRKLEIVKKEVLKYLEIEIENTLSECSVADSNLIVSNKVYEALQEAYQLIEDNFKHGDGQFTELQLAEERLRQCELNIFNARYRQMRSRAALLVTMGRTIIPMEGK
jgi:outer membrane protein